MFVSLNSNTTGASNETETTYPFQAPKLTPVLVGFIFFAEFE
jgi:hypothetical protein